MTRFLFDENVPLASADRIRAAGHDVARVRAGESDRAILTTARSEERIVVTYDRDFGFLVFRGGVPIPPGVVYFRTVPTGPESTAVELLAIVDSPGVTLEGRITVVEAGRVRQRPLPRV